MNFAEESQKQLESLVGVGNAFCQRYPKELAYFDSRVFTIPDKTEVYNYFIWRWKDCSRNSISMVAQSNFSHKELHGKSSKQKAGYVDGERYKLEQAPRTS